MWFNRPFDTAKMQIVHQSKKNTVPPPTSWTCSQGWTRPHHPARHAKGKLESPLTTFPGNAQKGGRQWIELLFDRHPHPETRQHYPCAAVRFFGSFRKVVWTISSRSHISQALFEGRPFIAFIFFIFHCTRERYVHGPPFRWPFLNCNRFGDWTLFGPGLY